MIAYGVWITTKVSDHHYDLGDMGQGHIMRKICISLIFHFLTKGGHIWHNNCLWCVDCNECSDRRYSIEIKCQSQIYTKSACIVWIVMTTPLIFLMDDSRTTFYGPTLLRNCITTPGSRQSKTLILSTNVYQKSLETEFSIAICRPTGDK